MAPKKKTPGPYEAAVLRYGFEAKNVNAAYYAELETDDQLVMSSCP